MTPDPEGRRAGDTLLPCPFCGGDPLPRPERVLRDGHEADEDDPDAFAYFIRCRCCAAEGGWAKTEFGARRQWNMRAAPAPEAAVGALARELRGER